MKSGIIVCGIAAAGLVLTAAVVRSQEKQDRDAETQAAVPGPVHKEMARSVGEYTTLTKFRAEPASSPVESSGTAKIQTALDGRFLLEENSGSLMGQPTKGLRLWGYNNASKKFEAMWTYTGSTSIMTLNGTSDDHGKTINWSGTFDTGKDGKRTIHVLTRHIDNDHFVVEIRGNAPNESGGPVMETTYTRKQ